MSIIGTVFSWIVILFFCFLPISWIWFFYHKLKCRKVKNCKKRRCSFWKICTHNEEEREREILEIRREYYKSILENMRERDD